MKSLKLLLVILLATFSVTAVNAQMGRRHVVVVRHHRHVIMKHHMVVRHHRP